MEINVELVDAEFEKLRERDKKNEWCNFWDSMKIYYREGYESAFYKSGKWPKLHDVKVAVKPRGKADASNFHDALVHYQAVKDTYLHMCKILGQNPH
jgi:hypothetical protein